IQDGGGHGFYAGSNGGIGDRSKFAGVRAGKTRAFFLSVLQFGWIGSAQPEHADWRFWIFQSEQAEIFASHDGFTGQDIFFSKGAFERGANAVREGHIVDRGWHVVLRYFD